MRYRIHYAYGCCTGKVRENNEDNFWCQGDMLPKENKGLSEIRAGSGDNKSPFILAAFDGMGGESCGEMASFLAAKTLGEVCDNDRFGLRWDTEYFLDKACRKMNRSICTYAEENRILSMGSTVAMAAFGRKAIYIANLGDSRIFQYREKELKLISTDHVLHREHFLRFGKAPLTQYLGIPENHMMIEPSIEKISYQNADRYLICSDGITDMLSEEKIAEIVEKEGTMSELCAELMKQAMEQGGKDNLTAILCEIEKEEPACRKKKQKRDDR